MNYDFTSLIKRENFDAIAVEPDASIGTEPDPDILEPGFDIIPMWIADMNFPTVPSIPKKIIERASHPAYGYFSPRREYYDAIISWQRTRHGLTGIEKENIGYENGVVGGIISTLRIFCSPGDHVLIHSPAYNGFVRNLKNNGFNLVYSPLKTDEKNIFRMDYDDMERKIKENHIHTAIFCSPHNPSGRVWEKEEIEQAMAIFKKNDVYVISDEIWSDLTLKGYTHIPVQSVSEDAKMRTIAFYAPSKTFNLAGLTGSYHIIYNKYIKDRLRRYESLCQYNEQNVLSMYALIGAYTKEGAAWTDELREVLSHNADYSYHFICKNFKEVKIHKPQGTYMLFLDCSEWCQKHNVSFEHLFTAGWKAGVWWMDGKFFHAPECIRMNLALPFSRISEALERLKKYVFI